MSQQSDLDAAGPVWYVDASDVTHPFGWTEDGDTFPIYRKGADWYPITTRRRLWWERTVRMWGPVFVVLLSRRAAVIAASIYVAIWFGGNLSFAYTHTCVRWHQEEVASGQDGDTRMETVCDYYTANGHRWTFLAPVRSLSTYW